MSAEVPSNWYPWRSAVPGWLVAAAFLAVGVPLFLRMPLWCDATLYAVAARTVAHGGVHYRDVFDTNPPGFVWLLCAVRGTLGTSSEALRLTDLLIVAFVTSGLVWWSRKAGATWAGVAWLAAAVAAFYPFTHEFNHVQRDVWMMLPAGLAVALRLRRVGKEPNPPSPFPGREGGGAWLDKPSRALVGCVAVPRDRHGSLLTAPPPSLPGKGDGGLGCCVLEGLLWGVGCWVKPQLLFVAFATWLATRSRFRWRDTLAVFAGGVFALLAGVGWLVASGTWPYFLDVWRMWNADYFGTVMRELPFRVFMQLNYFPLYSLCALLAVPLAVANVRSTSEEPEALRRKALAAVYLGWLATALLLQRPFHYVHIPETLLMLAVFAANRWPVPFALVSLQVAAGLLFALAGHSSAQIPPHPAFDTKRTRLWAKCLDANPPRAVRRDVAMWGQHFGAADPVELDAVADFLRTQDVRDGELIAWHDSPHALYRDLDVKPGFRFMHVGTAAGLGKWQEEAVLHELQTALPHARFAVSDMHRISEKYSELNDLDADGLPKVLPKWQRKEFPFNQPVAFRSPSGRYLVHRIVNPVTSARIPQRLDQTDPPEK